MVLFKTPSALSFNQTKLLLLLKLYFVSLPLSSLLGSFLFSWYLQFVNLGNLPCSLKKSYSQELFCTWLFHYFVLNIHI